MTLINASDNNNNNDDMTDVWRLFVVLGPNSITPTSPKLPRDTCHGAVTGKSRTSRTSSCLCRGDVTGLSRTCRGRHGEVGIMEFGLCRAMHVVQSAIWVFAPWSHNIGYLVQRETSKIRVE